MTDQEKPKEIGIRIKSILLDQFEATEAGRKMSQPLSDDAYEFQITFKFNVDSEDTLTVTSQFTLKVMSDKTVLAMMSLSMSFFVVDLNKFTLTNPDGKLAIDNNLGKILASVNISTSRGFFTVHSAPFNFRNAYLPIIDMNKFGQQQPQPQL